MLLPEPLQATSTVGLHAHNFGLPKGPKNKTAEGCEARSAARESKTKQGPQIRQATGPLAC